LVEGFSRERLEINSLPVFKLPLSRKKREALGERQDSTRPGPKEAEDSGDCLTD